MFKPKTMLIWSICWTIISLIFIATNIHEYALTGSRLSAVLVGLWVFSGYLQFRNVRVFLVLRAKEKDIDV